MPLLEIAPPSLSPVAATVIEDSVLDRVDLRENIFIIHPPGPTLLFPDFPVATVDDREIPAVLLDPVSGSGFGGSISKTSAHSLGSSKFIFDCRRDLSTSVFTRTCAKRFANAFLDRFKFGHLLFFLFLDVEVFESSCNLPSDIDHNPCYSNLKGAGRE